MNISAWSRSDFLVLSVTVFDTAFFLYNRPPGAVAAEWLVFMIGDIKYGSIPGSYQSAELDFSPSGTASLNEIDSERVFFSEPEAAQQSRQSPPVEIAIEVDLIETELEENEAFQQEPVAPRLDDAEFERRKKAISSAFHRYSQILIDRIEEQTTIILEKDREIKNLERQIRLLPDMEKQARQRDEEAKLAAFESAAKYEVEGDGVKQGFDLLLERAFGDHQARRRAVEAVIAGLRTHANELGRHEQYPAVHVSRAEAEFAFASTVSVFSLISRCLAQRAAKGR